MTDALLTALGLKRLLRAGWVRRGVPAPESVAGHSWGVAWLVLVLLPEDLDRERALTYALLHDLPEVHTGDLTPEDGVSRAEKHAREQRAMAKLCEGLPPELLSMWQMYEAQSDPESKFVRQLDRLDMALQAVAYTRTGTDNLSEFLSSAAQTITDPSLVAILDTLHDILDDGEPHC